MAKWQWLTCLYPPRSTQDSAILADDMHLGLRVPGTWFSGGVDKPLVKHIEKIALPRCEAIDFEVRNSAWGPVMPGRLPRRPARAEMAHRQHDDF